LLLTNPLLQNQRSICLKNLTGYYCDEDGVGHCVYSTKLAVVVVVGLIVLVVVVVVGIVVVFMAAVGVGAGWLCG